MHTIYNNCYKDNSNKNIKLLYRIFKFRKNKIDKANFKYTIALLFIQII